MIFLVILPIWIALSVTMLSLCLAARSGDVQLCEETPPPTLDAQPNCLTALPHPISEEPGEPARRAA
jgi:hypothetical protein